MSADTTDSNTILPSALPSADSHARSGCGIRPTTLRVALQMPAMLWSDPFGLRLRRDLAFRRDVAEDHLPVRFKRRDRLRIRVVVALAVRDGDLQHLPLARRGS